MVASLGGLEVLKSLYANVIVPREVADEILVGGSSGFAVQEFEQAEWLDIRQAQIEIPPYLSNSLDPGEASVIHTAIVENLKYVCIDEAAGRRIARLHDLNLTGSIGILIRAKKSGFSFSMKDAINNMTEKGIWLSRGVIEFALTETGEK